MSNHPKFLIKLFRLTKSTSLHYLLVHSPKNNISSIKKLQNKNLNKLIKFIDRDEYYNNLTSELRARTFNGNLFELVIYLLFIF